MLYNGLDLYYIDLDPNDDYTGIDAISLVDDAAVECDFLTFSKDKPKMVFAKDDERHIITGIAMSANKPIYRRNADGYEYYTLFTPKSIERLVVDYAKKGLQNSVNLQHNDNTFQNGIYMIESYFVNKERGIAPKEFEVEDGSYVVSYKVENEELWDEIKNSGELNGFSIQGYFNLKEEDYKQTVEPTFDEWVDSFLPDQDEKKKFDKNTPVTVDIANRAIKNKRQVVIDGKQGQVLAVAKENNKPNIIFQDNNGKWSKIYLDDIKKWTLTDEPLIDWNWDDPEYQKLIDDEDNIIEETSVATATTLEDAINGNYVTIINYNDESDSPATGARQCWVSSLGYTTAGNGCVRIFEQYGASKSGIQANEGWRLLLVRRITSFRILTDVEPYFEAPSKLYNGEAQAGSGKNGTMSSVRAKSRLI